MIFRSITLQEANVFLPLVKERFASIHALVAEGQMLHDAISKTKDSQTATATTDSAVEASVPSAKAQNNYQKRRLKKIEAEVRDKIIDLQCYGAIVKSVFPARVDFRSEMHRQPIYLCWQTGDKTVSHWHPIDEGFSSRRFIQAPQSFGPVVLH
ncbi:MAG: DUF2203 domain-containing protein [bacterium]|nr:DUF2203 domain-containing protein [bacterium]